MSSYFRTYGGAPVEFSAQGLYNSGSGKDTLRFSFFQKLTDKDYNSTSRTYPPILIPTTRSCVSIWVRSNHTASL